MPFLKSAAAAGAQAEKPGDGIDQAPGLPGIDQRAEGETAGGDAPGIVDAGEILGQGDLDEREALVVLEPDVERGQVAVHQVALQQQGVGLGLGDDGFQGSSTAPAGCWTRGSSFFWKYWATRFFRLIALPI